ncbi:MAG: hypothetical protein LBT51_08185 [Fusobacteriaceae bacterium]|nr:hypothetical protein [Fusobacteriaceae bacterium]
MNLTILGFLMLAVITILVLSNRVNLIAAFSAIPLLFALLGGFDIKKISGFVQSGINSTFTAVILILFAVAFFSLLSETCMFEILVNAILKISGSNVYVILIATVVIATIAHLDGSFNTTYLITIPALLPLYKKLGIDKKYLLVLTVMAACPMTALPWSSVAVMVATFADANPVDMWRHLIPLQVAGTLTAFAFAIIIGVFVSKQNKNRTISAEDANLEAKQFDFTSSPYARPKLFWVNFFIFVGCLVTLMTVKLPTYFLFMLFFDITLVVNYPNAKDQKDLIKKYAATMLNPCLIFLAIGVMVGVMKDSGMVTGMITAIMSLIPSSMTRYAHVIIGLLSVPILVFIPYQLFYSFFPILIGIGATFGFSSIACVLPFVMLHGSQCSPMTAAANLCAELGGFEITQHCRNIFIPLWIACTITIIVGAVSGAFFLGPI